MTRMNLPRIPPVDSISLGQLGADFISDTATHTGDWAVIECWTDAVFASLITNTISINDAAPGEANAIQMTKGQVLRGRFQTIDLTSGSVIAYRASIPQT